jgi:transcriptional regulator with XRE-family HTH domain
VGALFGELVARKRHELGLSQSKLASVLCRESGTFTLTRHEVSRYERGEVVPGPYWLRHLAAALDLDPAELRAAAAADRGEVAEAGADWLRTAHEWLVLEAPHVAHRRAGRRIGMDLVAELERRVAELRRLDDHLDGSQTYELVAAELDRATRLLGEAAYTERVGRRVLGVVGELGQLAGWVAADAGLSDVAREHYLTGARAAHDGGRADIVANCLSSLSYQMATTGSARDAVLLASTAVKGTTGEHPTVQALMLDRLAWAYARRGDPQSAERALDQAADHLVNAADPPAWLYWLDQTEADIMAGRCWTELHRPLRAVPLLEETTARLPADSVRELALYLSWLAIAYADAREPERAAEVGTRVLALTGKTASRRVDERLGRVLDRLAEYASVPAVAELTANAGHRAGS